MKVQFLAGVLLFCLLALEDSEAAPLKKEILKVGRDCKDSRFQPKDGSICLKLTVVAGVKVNFGVGYEEKDEKKNSENKGKSKTLNRYQEQKWKTGTKEKEQKKKLKDPRKT